MAADEKTNRKRTSASIAKTFSEILKFNPYHGKDGRFSSANGYASFTYAQGKSRAHDMAIAREKERMAAILPSKEQDKTLKGIEQKTRNLKKEQLRVVDRDGNVIMQKQGGKDYVSYTVGEARESFYGNVTIHNHPDGGTFSTPDLSDFGYGVKKADENNMRLFLGLQITGADSMAIDGGEDPKDFHITLAYGTFEGGRSDEDGISAEVQEAISKITEYIPEEIRFDEIGRFEASESSDGKDVIYARVASGQLEKAHDELMKSLKERGINLETTFPEYKPHMTLAYIEPGAEYELGKIDETGKASKYMIGFGKESTHENNYTILKADEDKRLIFGWASVAVTADGKQLEDLQQDMIDPEDLEEAVYEYVLNFRDTGEEHIPSMRMKGKLVESCVFTEEKQQAIGIPAGTLPVGWWVGFKIFDDDAWEKVKNGTYKMFSIEGVASREPIEKSGNGDDEENMYYDNIIEISSRKRLKKRYSRYDEIHELPVAKSFRQSLDNIEKFNPYHGKDGRFASANGAASFTYAPGKSKAHDLAIARERDRVARQNRSYGSTNTKDVLDEINSGKSNSMAAFLDKNGNLTPEREAVHKKIIDKLLEGKIPVNGQATMTMLGGGPASGKSSVMNPDTSGDPHSVTVDPDAIKKMLPGFEEMAKASPNAAAYYHEESSALAKRFSEVAYKENYNVIYDGTGDGSVKSVQKKIDGAKANGYKVEAKYVSIDTEEAVRRNQKRYDDAVARGETPRLPPVDMVIKTHTRCTDISVEMASKFDRIEVWDNNGARGQQKMIATGGGGKGLKAVAGQEQSFNRYLSKGTNGLEGFATLPDGTVIPIE